MRKERKEGDEKEMREERRGHAREGGMQGLDVFIPLNVFWTPLEVEELKPL